MEKDDGSIKLKKPKTDFCYEIHSFGQADVCPDLDDRKARNPICNKYHQPLTWSVSGRTLKCMECEQ